ncbi:putative cell cycle control protein cwf14 [Phaeomoniella chlamydospora]|uniref:Putative cell cycle control protein cwf14 n=1 Tax=Phaeomoniella chlamydospora TaxID=158046 RepID=A0A0G2ETH2_PHACM|nr:putative cell cycle control protein cwf14 [Phaeomoniella chlamydospora]
MPPIRSARNRKPPPDGFEDLEDTLLEFSNKMKDAENASHEGKKKHETLWPIFQISHARSRYIYDLYYNRDPPAISKKLYDWLLKNNYADANLIAKWKKQGYEKLCCLRCIQTKETNFSSTCICRVPKAQLKEGEGIECSMNRPLTDARLFEAKLPNFKGSIVVAQIPELSAMLSRCW